MPRRKGNKKKLPLNKRLRGGNSNRYKGFGRMGKVNSWYHPSVPRTLQIATRRYKSQILRFVVNQTYKCVPQVGNPVVGPENCFLRFQANSIHDIVGGSTLAGDGSQNMPGTWIPQDSANYGPSVSEQFADGYDEWKERYQHFTVLGSRCQATCQTIVGTSAQEIGTFYMNLAGHSGIITNTSQMKDINTLPYTKRARLFPSVQQQAGSVANVPGARLALNYSTKKFEGVSDVMDNSQLRGGFDNGFGQGNSPSEKSFYTIGYVPTMPYNAQSGAHAPALITIKIEYIVKLTEPTNTNNVSA